MKEKLAIVGSHPGTRDLAPWDDENFDIWTINESATMKDTFVKRATGIFQMHPRGVWDSPKNQNDPHHGEWLKQNKTATIYMIEKYPDIPMAEKYPMDEIVEKYLTNLNVMCGRKRRNFFTTTVAYMVALAAYKGYKQVDFYGVELQVESEYRYQRPGAMFWIGILLQYAEVNFYGMMFEAPLYGIEVDGEISLEMLETRKEQLLPSHIKHTGLLKEASDGFAKTYNRFRNTGVEHESMLEAMKTLTSELSTYGRLSGAIQELDRKIDKAKTQLTIDKEFWFSHHEFERDAAAINTSKANALLEHAHFAGMCDAVFTYSVNNRLTDSKRKAYLKDLDGLLPKYTQLCETVGIYEGAAEENNFLAKLIKDQLIGAE